MLRRLLTSLFLVAFAAASIFVTQPQIVLGEQPSVTKVTVNPKDLQLVCPGAFYRSGADTGATVNAFSQIASAALSGTFAPSSAASLKVANFDSVVVGQNPSGSVAAPITITASGSTLAQGSALLNANQLQLINDSRAAGLLAAACLKPESDFWMLSGDTSVGRESLLILNNPGAVNATVSIEVFGAGGKIETAGQEGISVPAAGSTVVPIASLAPDLPTLAIHVRSVSSAITATLQQKTVRGLVAAGADWTSPSLVLANNLVIPGFFVRGTKDASKLRSISSDYGDTSAVLRVFLPPNSKANATVTAQVVGTDAKTFGTVVRQTLPVGTVTDIPLNGLQDGDYSVFISSDQPIRAAVRLSRSKLGGKPATDFTWLQAATPLKTQVAITAPTTGISKLSIANSAKSAIAVSLTINGSVKSVSVPALNSVTVSVPSGAKITLSSGQPFEANLIADVNFALANLPVVDYQNVGSFQSVLVR